MRKRFGPIRNVAPSGNPANVPVTGFALVLSMIVKLVPLTIAIEPRSLVLSDAPARLAPLVMILSIAPVPLLSCSTQTAPLFSVSAPVVVNVPTPWFTDGFPGARFAPDATVIGELLLPEPPNVPAFTATALRSEPLTSNVPSFTAVGPS